MKASKIKRKSETNEERKEEEHLFAVLRGIEEQRNSRCIKNRRTEEQPEEQEEEL